jgi:CheY-like chemotaxis protein
VDTFTSGEEVLAQLMRGGSEAGKPQLILLDYDVPGVDAKDALRKFKGDEELRSIPIVVLTSQHNPNIIRQCYGLGANSVLCKANQLRDYFLQIQQLAKYWLLVNAAATSEFEESEALEGILPTHSSRFNELRN